VHILELPASGQKCVNGTKTEKIEKSHGVMQRF
jgi:hypothetical protein